MITDRGKNNRNRLLYILSHITIITLLMIFFKVWWESGKIIYTPARCQISVENVTLLTFILVLTGFIMGHHYFTGRPAGYGKNLIFAARGDSSCGDKAYIQKQPGFSRIRQNKAIFRASNPPGADNNIPGDRFKNSKPADDTLSQRLTKLTHELRTPMIGILGSVDLLEHSPLTQVQMSSVETIRICGERLLHIIDDMLEASKTNRSVLDIDLSPAAQPQMPEKTIETSCQAAAEEDLFNVGFSPVSVLLVEDNELNQKLLAQMLINYGFEVLTAGNGWECLNILQQKNINIILMDMQMPLMDGYETTRIIRENPAWKQLPIIAVTANSLASDRQKCLDCGCSSYLAKPFKSETLVREIKNYLHNQFIKEKNADLLSQQLITDLLPEFMEMLSENLQELKYAIDEKDMAAIKNISHGLKGTAGMYGFMQISELASYLEQAARDKNYQRMTLLYQQIASFVQRFSCMNANKVVG